MGGCDVCNNFPHLSYHAKSPQSCFDSLPNAVCCPHPWSTPVDSADMTRFISVFKSPLFESIHAVEKVLFSSSSPSSSSLQPSPGAAVAALLSQLAPLGAGLPSMHHSEASEHIEWAYILLAQWVVFADHVLWPFWERVNKSEPRRQVLWQETFQSTFWFPSIFLISWKAPSERNLTPI